MKEGSTWSENRSKTLQVCKPYLSVNNSTDLIRKMTKLIILDEADNMTKAA